MSRRSAGWVLLVGMWLVLAWQAQGIRFGINKEECLHHDVPYDGDQVSVSYVVISSDGNWGFDHTATGIDLIVEGPGGHQVHTSKDKVEEKFDFIATRRGLYKFCFFNRHSNHEHVDFDVQTGYHIQSVAKDEHIDPLMTQIERLEGSLYSIKFEQHWLIAQTDRQEIANHAMNKRFMYKAVLEAACLVGCSLLQVVLLRRLFERKSAQTSRV